MNPVSRMYERWIEMRDPARAVERQRQRMALDELRSYDAAKANRLSSYGRRNGRASDEVSKGHRGLAGGSQHLVRNTALGNRIKAIISANIVGTGIKPDIQNLSNSGRSKQSVERYKSAYDEWANSVACDYEGHNNLYGLQALWAGTIAESGGVFIRQIIDDTKKFPLVLQTLEQQYLDESKSGQQSDGEIINGIHFNDDGRVKGYWLKTRLVGMTRQEQSKFYSAGEVIHVFRKDRPGQHLGVSWLHPIANLIDMRQEWRDTALLQQRIAACFGVVIKEPPKDMGLSSNDPTLRDADGAEYSELEQGMIAYTGKETEITTITPPNMSHATDFNSEVVQDIAVGVGVTREQITGDFSKVSWASGRLARGEFYGNLDQWQKFMMLPALDRVHNWFDDVYTVTAGMPKNIARSWIMPHRSAVNPKEELEVDIMKVRSAAMTPQQFTAKHGLKFEEVIQGWTEAKVIMGEMPFDFDPSKFSRAGNQLDDNDAASSNKAGEKSSETETDAPEK